MPVNQLIPDLAAVLSDAEANLRLMPNTQLERRLHELADTSDAHYFRLLIRAVCLTEPLSLPGPREPPPGSQWYWVRVRGERLERVVSLLDDMRRVAMLTLRDLRKIYRQAEVPSRYRYNWKTCIDVARFAVGVVDDPEFGSLERFFARYINLGDGGRQTALREAILARCEGISDASLSQFIEEAGLAREVWHWAVVSLCRLGLIDCDPSRPFDAGIRKDAVAMLMAIADASGRPYRYVQEVLHRGAGFSALWDLVKRDSAVCFHDLQRCDVCRHRTYCQRSGGLDEDVNGPAGWLRLYPAYRTALSRHVTTLGALSGTAVEAVLALIALSNALWWQAEPVRVSTAELWDISASLIRLPTNALYERCRRRMTEYFAGSPNWYGHVTEAEKLKAEDLARRNFPCVLEQEFPIESDHGGPVVSDPLLLDIYRLQGRPEIPVLAVDWGSIGRIGQDRRMAKILYRT